MYFTANPGGVNHIWRQRFPDGQPEQITSGPTEEEGMAMAPDGRYSLAPAPGCSILMRQLLPSRLALGFSERLVVGLNPGDRLLLFTDGITEASGPNGEEFGKRNSPRLRKPTVEVPHQS
jgi:hypothetical protein